METSPYDRKSCNSHRVVPGLRHWESGVRRVVQDRRGSAASLCVFQDVHSGRHYRMRGLCRGMACCYPEVQGSCTSAGLDVSRPGRS